MEGKRWNSTDRLCSISKLIFRKYVKEKDVADDICEALQGRPDFFICSEAHMRKKTQRLI